MKQFRVFLVGILCAIFGTSAFAGVGEVDNRKYADWRKYPEIVHLRTHAPAPDYGGGECTGQYIAPNLILTGSHCIKDETGKIQGGKSYAIRPGSNYKAPDPDTGQYTDETDKNFEHFEITLLYSPDEYKKTDKTGDQKNKYDWAVFKVEDPNFYARKYYDLSNVESNISYEVYNLGFGYVRVLTKDNINAIRTVYENWQKSDPHNTEDLFTEFNNILSPFTLQDDFDNHLLKIDPKCSVKDNDEKYIVPQGMVRGHCDVWAGNSGGAIVNANNKNLIAILKSGNGSFEFSDETQNMQGVASNVFSDTVRQLMSQNPPQTVEEPQNDLSQYEVANTDGNITVPTDPNFNGEHVVVSSGANATQLANMQGLDASGIIEGVMSANTANIEEELAAEKKKIWAEADTKIAPIIRKKGANLTDKELVHFIAEPVAEAGEKIKRLEKAYKKAKEREQSLANRTLTALTMAATGVGGMELARGLAEQKADKAAEADMTAYMSTFQCKVGDKRYTGNDTQIEIAGGNELIKLYQEYVDLANSLKERKAALGKKAGIESEVILDKANMGLYDETGKGIENGTYASLYRAARGNENDVAKIQEQQDASKKRVIAGAVVAGAGVVGGTIGNLAINGKKDSTDDDDDIVTEKYTVKGDTVSTRKGEEERAEDLANEITTTRTPGCTVNSSVSTIPDACKSHYASDTNEQARCLKCVNNAGTYEAGRCYVEVIGWACLGKGWPQDNKPNSPAPCSTMSNRYQDCHIVRKYADAEKPFTCDPMTSIAPGKTALVSGCGQHGWSVGDKHPPFNLDGPNAVGQNCKLPLSSNMAWRKMYSKGSAIGVTFGGKTVTTGRWCMPSANSSPWNDSNHSGTAKHLLPSSLMAGGESKDKWFSLD